MDFRVFMIKIRIVAVGKVKEKYFADGIEEYSKRLSRFCDFKIIEIKEENFNGDPTAKDIADIKRTEGERIEKELKGFVTVAAIEGEKFDSVSFAGELKSKCDKMGVMTFVIGGSYGVDDEIKRKADRLVSFSDMTFPHTLFRLLLTEQIYRAFMINGGSAYHK
mgnify:CR=1 FL=1